MSGCVAPSFNFKTSEAADQVFSNHVDGLVGAVAYADLVYEEARDMVAEEARLYSVLEWLHDNGRDDRMGIKVDHIDHDSIGMDRDEVRSLVRRPWPGCTTRARLQRSEQGIPSGHVEPACQTLLVVRLACGLRRAQI